MSISLEFKCNSAKGGHYDAIASTHGYGGVKHDGAYAPFYRALAR